MAHSNGKRIEIKRYPFCRFTLLELLIVVAIIMILASILMPAMGKVRAKAKEIGCANNAKQIGIMFMNYMDDCGGFFPYYALYNNDEEAESDNRWNNVLRRNYLNTRNSTNEAWKNFACPGHPSDMYKNQYIHYGYNHSNIGSSTRLGIAMSPESAPAKASSLTRPSNILLAADSFQWNNENEANMYSGYYRGYYIIRDNPASGPGTSAYMPYAVHQGGFNVLWCDGHVKSVKGSMTDYSKAYSAGSLGDITMSENKWKRQ